MNFHVKEIGKVSVNEKGMYIQLHKEYIPALQGLNGFSHIDVFWWCSNFDTEQARKVYETPRPYKKAPDIMGIFATRSPIRPNPIALSISKVLDIDYENGVIFLDYIDAEDKTPVLDIKPYTPSCDRVETPTVPEWCIHWPKNYETSGEFDWQNEFIF